MYVYIHHYKNLTTKNHIYRCVYDYALKYGYIYKYTYICIYECVERLGSATVQRCWSVPSALWPGCTPDDCHIHGRHASIVYISLGFLSVCFNCSFPYMLLYCLTLWQYSSHIHLIDISH